MAGSQREEHIVLQRHFTPDQAGSYQLLSFTVPPGVTQLVVRYDYTERISAKPQETGGNTIDLGLFDARGAAFPAAGFRGWSGSERGEIKVGREGATPGYLPGPLPPGEWHVLLGLYKVAPQGCDCTVEVTFTFDPAAESSNPPERTASETPFGVLADPLPRPGLDGWYRGDLHCHTWHSDGDSPPQEVIATAERMGLDFLAITDHNTVSTLRDIGPGRPSHMLLIPGLEVTTYKGHANVWGLTEWVDFRCPDDLHMAQTLATARARGGLVSCNHPRPQGPSWQFAMANGYDCVEVWNGPWPVANEACVAFWEAHLRQGRRVPAVGGSDTHRLRHRSLTGRWLGVPTTWVYCPQGLTQATLFSAIRAGHVFISRMPCGPQLYLWADADGDGRYELLTGDEGSPAGDTVTIKARAMGASGRVLSLLGPAGVVRRCTIRHDDYEDECVVPAERYVRAQIEQDSEVVALTNPIYFQTQDHGTSDAPRGHR